MGNKQSHKKTKSQEKNVQLFEDFEPQHNNEGNISSDLSSKGRSDRQANENLKQVPLSEINENDWVQITKENMYYRPEYGKLSVFRSKTTFQEYEKYNTTLNDKEAFEGWKQIYKWRQNPRYSDYIVQMETYEEKMSKSGVCCSFQKNLDVYIERCPLRLSDLTDIPFPENLYFLVQVLKGFKYLMTYPFSSGRNFKVTQDMICVTNQGVIKVWMNPDLSVCQPIPSNQRMEFYAQEDIINSLLKMIEGNTNHRVSIDDTEGETMVNGMPVTHHLSKRSLNPQRHVFPFRSYLHQKGISISGDFNIIIEQLYQYARDFSTKIPSRAHSVKDVIEINAYIYRNHHLSNMQSPKEEFQNSHQNGERHHPENQQNNANVVRMNDTPFGMGNSHKIHHKGLIPNRQHPTREEIRPHEINNYINHINQIESKYVVRQDEQFPVQKIHNHQKQIENEEKAKESQKIMESTRFGQTSNPHNYPKSNQTVYFHQNQMRTQPFNHQIHHHQYNINQTLPPKNSQISQSFFIKGQQHLPPGYEMRVIKRVIHRPPTQRQSQERQTNVRENSVHTQRQYSLTDRSNFSPEQVSSSMRVERRKVGNKPNLEFNRGFPIQFFHNKPSVMRQNVPNEQSSSITASNQVILRHKIDRELVSLNLTPQNSVSPHISNQKSSEIHYNGPLAVQQSMRSLDSQSTSKNVKVYSNSSQNHSETMKFYSKKDSEETLDPQIAADLMKYMGHTGL